MKTKKAYFKTLSVIAAFFISNILYAQQDANATSPPSQKDGKSERQQERKENIETMKIGFITKKLDLTSEEAERFWPIYNQYNGKIQEIRKQRRQNYRDAKQKFDEMSDNEVEQAVDNEMASRQKELDIQKEYNSKFKAILPIKKVAKLYAAEEQFKMELLNKLKDKERKTPVRD